jgi:hypothetical protein
VTCDVWRVSVSLPRRSTAHALRFNSADALAKLQAAGGSVAASAKECAAGADFVVTMLPSNATGARAGRLRCTVAATLGSCVAVLKTYSDIAGSVKRGAVLIDSSTGAARAASPPRFARQPYPPLPRHPSSSPYSHMLSVLQLTPRFRAPLQSR